MKQNNYRGEWVRSSSTPKRDERLKAHEEFEASELKKMLDEGWKVTKAAVKHKRPRIQRENFKVVMVFNKPMKLTLQEYNDHFTLAFGK